LARKGEWKAMGGLIDDEVLDAFAVVAPLDQLPGAFGRRVAGLVERTSLSLPRGFGTEQTVEMLRRVRQAINSLEPKRT
jgi:hypothetical protein